MFSPERDLDLGSAVSGVTTNTHIIACKLSLTPLANACGLSVDHVRLWSEEAPRRYRTDLTKRRTLDRQK